MSEVIGIREPVEPGDVRAADERLPRVHDHANGPSADVEPPAALSFGQVHLRFVQVFPGDAARGLVPYYHFRILLADESDVGHINFRIGETEHVRLCAGHLGYEVAESFRGQGHAAAACRAIAPFVRRFYSVVMMTCDPDNFASIRTIERLGGRYLDEITVPPHDPQYQRGSRRKRRYEWVP